MRKKVYLIIIMLFTLIPFNIKAYTRKDLEEFVVSTALSYFYNNGYTDYEGAWHDNAESLYTHDYHVSPEMLGRSNYMITQCDAFIASTYIHSLGYDFLNYYNKLASYRFTRYSAFNTKDYIYGNVSISNFKNLYNYFGKGFSVAFMNKVASDYIVSNKPDSDNIVIYYKKCKTGDKAACLETAATYVSNNIRPGDILLNDGHAMLWVGDALENTCGAIHSSGSSYNFSNGYSGYDDASVRYSDSAYIINKQVKAHGSKENTSVAILRPINYFCGKNTNTTSECSKTSSINKNVLARRELNRLRVEQYIYDPNSEGRSLNYNNSSIGQGDTISYRLYLSNKSNLEYCSSDSLVSKENCKKNGSYNVEWKNANKNVTYENVKITAKIPSGTTFVSCSYSCTHSGDTVTWENVMIDPKTSKTYYYTVRVNNDSSIKEIKNSGMKVTYNKKDLQLTSITTKVNPTITGKYKDILLNQINNDIGKSCTSSKNYIADFYNNYFKNQNINASGTALSELLTYNNLVNGVFTKYREAKDTDYNSPTYRRNISSDITNLTDNQKIINSMLVEKVYGGRMYEHLLYSNTNEMERIRKVVPIWSTLNSLNIGDIVVTIKNSVIDVMLYTGTKDGTQSIVYCNNGKVTKLSKETTTYNEKKDVVLYSNRYFLDKVHNSNLYFVLRPSAYYNPKLKYTLTYNTNGGNEWNTSACKSGFTYNNNEKSCKKTSEYKNKYGSFPAPTKNGYNLSGWAVYLYNSKTQKYDIKTTINSNSIFDVGYNQTVYAQWTPKIYSVEIDSENRSIYEKFNTSWCSDNNCKNAITNIKIPQKNGYIFKGYYTSKNGQGKMVADELGNIVKDTTKIFDDTTSSKKIYAYFIQAQDNKPSYDQVIINLYNPIFKKLENKQNNYYIIINKQYSSKKLINNLNDGIRIEINNKNDNLYTGGKTIIYENNKKVKEYINILLGDINGDGFINSADYIKIKKHIMQSEIIKNDLTIAADVNSDSKITSADYIKIKKYIMNGEAL